MTYCKKKDLRLGTLPEEVIDPNYSILGLFPISDRKGHINRKIPLTEQDKLLLRLKTNRDNLCWERMYTDNATHGFAKYIMSFNTGFGIGGLAAAIPSYILASIAEPGSIQPSYMLISAGMEFLGGFLFGFSGMWRALSNKEKPDPERYNSYLDQKAQKGVFYNERALSKLEEVLAYNEKRKKNISFKTQHT